MKLLYSRNTNIYSWCQNRRGVLCMKWTKIKGNSFWCVQNKRSKNFYQVKNVLPMIFISLGRTTVTSRSETLLCIKASSECTHVLKRQSPPVSSPFSALNRISFHSSKNPCRSCVNPWFPGSCRSTEFALLRPARSPSPISLQPPRWPPPPQATRPRPPHPYLASPWSPINILSSCRYVHW